ncbi:MAG: hypothetical protein WBL95_18670 [Microcoleus sp.]
MPSKSVALVLSTSFIVALTSQPSIAFTLTQNTGLSNYSSLSILDKKYKGTGLTALNALAPDAPLNLSKAISFVSQIKLGGTRGFLEDLNLYRNEGWTFKQGRELKGSFNVKLQYPCGTKNSCGQGTKLGIDTRGIGSALSLIYRPGTSKRQPNPDPKNRNNLLYWIQRVTTNYPDKNKGPICAKRSSIDNLSPQGNNATYPYYSFGNPLSSNRLFEHRHDRPDTGNNLNRNYYWTAELYLAQANLLNQREVTIYNGVRWGWTYEYFPNQNPVPVPVPTPTPNPIPFPIPFPSIPKIPNFGEPNLVRSSASGGGEIGYVAVSPTPSPSPTPRPSPRPAPAPSPRPAPAPSPRQAPAPSPRPSPTPSPRPSPTPSPRPTPRPTPRPAPAPSPRPAPAPSPRPAPAPSRGGRPIQAVPSSWIPNANVSNLRKSSLFESSSKANTDYLTAISSDLLEDSELSSTDNSLNNANLANISSDLLENPELSSTDSNENQVNLANLSSDLLEDSELSSTDNNENQVNLAGISSDLLEDSELSSTDNNENNADIGGISADLLEDPELSSEDNNSNQVDLAGISADLLEYPELSYLDDTLTAETPKVSSKKYRRRCPLRRSRSRTNHRIRNFTSRFCMACN